MFGLIKTTIRLAIFTSIYAIIFAHIAGWTPDIITAFATRGDMPAAVSTSLLCTVQTLNWLFGSSLVNLAIYIWLFTPPVKLGIYFLNKASHM